jgi:hypothetical protein
VAAQHSQCSGPALAMLAFRPLTAAVRPTMGDGTFTLSPHSTMSPHNVRLPGAAMA